MVKDRDLSNIFVKYQKKKTSEYKELIEKYSPYLSANLNIAKNLKFSDIMYNLKTNPNTLKTKNSLMESLRHAKKQASILTAINDISDKWNTQTSMTNLSIFADFCVELALKFVINEAHKRAEIENNDINKSGISVIAIGKLGSYELNYSSDIDLIFIYDKKKSSIKNKQNAEKVFIKIAEEVSEILNKLTKNGYVFRVDTKIKPDMTSSALAIDIDFAKHYYTNFSQTWEKTTMLKARFITGDFRTGNEFIGFLDKWLWNKELSDENILNLLDIQEYNAHKENDEHINIKFDPYRIRDIELFVKTNQLINSPQQDKIKTSNTLEAIKFLSKAEIISKNDAKKLTNIYLFLRDIEHRLQMIDDKQTYQIYRDKETLCNFAKFMGYKTKEEFLGYLETAKIEAKEIFNKPIGKASNIIKPSNRLIFSGINDNEETLKILTYMGFKHPRKITSAIKNWLYGRYDIAKDEQTRYKMIEIIPDLLQAISKSYNPDNAFDYFNKLLQNTNKRSSIFSLFIKEPHYMKLIANALGSSKEIAEYIITDPDIIQKIVSSDFFKPLQSFEELEIELRASLKDTKNYKEALNTTSEFVKNKKFQAGINVINKTTKILYASKFLSDVAEATVTCILPYIHKEFEKEYGYFNNGKFALIAIGSLGAKQFSPHSDLDFIPIYHLDSYNVKSNGKTRLNPNEYYIKLMQKIINDFSLKEIKIYEVDPRIRPEGDTGPIASSLKNFIEYQNKHEDSWEYTSLIKGRILSKDKEMKPLILKEIGKIISTPKDTHLLNKYMLKQRSEIKERFKARSIWDIKYIDGGILDISFIAKYLILNSCVTNANSNGLILSLEKLIKYKLIDEDKGKALLSSYKLLQKTNFFLKLVGNFPFNPKNISEKSQKIMCDYILGDKNTYSIEDLEGKISLSLAISKQIFDEVFILKE